MTAEDTKLRLVDAGLRAFAAHGVQSASLLEVTRMADQRNRGAVHYHFGSREGLLVAVLEQYADALGARELELLAVAQDQPDDDIGSVVEAIVRPIVEVAETGWRGRCYLQIISQLTEDDPDSWTPPVREVLTRTGGFEVFALLETRLPRLPANLHGERQSLAVSFMLRAVADRARLQERENPARPHLPTETFIANLISMTVAMLLAPVPPI